MPIINYRQLEAANAKRNKGVIVELGAAYAGMRVCVLPQYATAVEAARTKAQKQLGSRARKAEGMDELWRRVMAARIIGIDATIMVGEEQYDCAKADPESLREVLEKTFLKPGSMDRQFMMEVTSAAEPTENLAPEEVLAEAGQFFVYGTVARQDWLEWLASQVPKDKQTEPDGERSGD